MPTQDLTVRRAGPDDLATLLPLIREFYEVDRHPYDEPFVTAALRPLLDGDGYGQVFLACRPDPIGYAVLTWSYSLESGGRDCILDEIYLRERGNGHGGRLLTSVLDAARAAGARALFLETEAHNTRVRGFYARHGLAVEDSVWMSTRIA
jgi:GNAT superfamily N-acetyltransferase